jgi:nickel-dependent lactate racemase
MQVHIAYGKLGLDIQFLDTWDVTVVQPRFVPEMPDAHQAIMKALRVAIESPSLKDLVRSGDKVGIIFSDLTRPTPNHLIIPTILEELSCVPEDNITLFNALGTHRQNTHAELCTILGEGLVDRYRIVQNDAFDSSTQVYFGKTIRGNDIWLNHEIAECGIKILTGFIEPHFFAGFSGGGKALMPGMAGVSTILSNHNARNIGDPDATWGVTCGNPIWEEIQEVAHNAGRTFLVNVTLNKEKRITGVFAGDLVAAYSLGCEFVRKAAMVPVPREYDIVISSNSGHPLDLNLYQAVKGMSAASLIVRKGGSIIIAADCWDGIPEHGLYGKLLREANDPQKLLDRINSPGFLEHDQWQAQIQALIQLKADVYVYSGNLTDSQIVSSLLNPCRSIEQLIEELLIKYGSDATICVIPEGPQTIPYIQRRKEL